MRAWMKAGMGVVCVLFASCAGSTTSGTGGPGAATKSDVTELCKQQCERNVRCGNADPNCQAECEADVTRPEIYRHDFLTAYIKCIESLECSKNDDSCLETAANAVNTSWQNDPLPKKCLDRQNECGSFSDDVCGGAVYFTAPARQTLESCLNEACESIDQCIEGLK